MVVLAEHGNRWMRVRGLLGSGVPHAYATGT